MTDLPPFPGFRAEAFQFLVDLREHNDREWFKARKAVYEDELLWPAKCLVAEVSAACARAGVPLRADASKGVFRIYRDTRFSKNKDPYKTHVGLVWTRSGGKDDPGALYVHIEPGNCSVHAGYWQPEPPLLRRWRERLAADPAGWLAVAEQVADAGLELSAWESLKRMPSGYEAFAESEVADALRRKGAFTTRRLPDAAAQTPGFADEIVAAARASLPLLEWGWALDSSPDDA